METKPITLKPGKTYLISQSGNNQEIIFPEKENERYFIRLMEYHVPRMGHLLEYRLSPQAIQFIVKVKPGSQIPEQYMNRVHQPISNMFNAYTKAFNKYYNRSGSLFTKNFERKTIWTEEQLDFEIQKLINPGTKSFHSFSEKLK